MTSSHCAGTTKMWLMKSRERVTEEICLQTTSEYSQIRHGRDTMWKTAPNTSCCDWKRPIRRRSIVLSRNRALNASARHTNLWFRKVHQSLLFTAVLSYLQPDYNNAKLLIMGCGAIYISLFCRIWTYTTARMTNLYSSYAANHHGHTTNSTSNKHHRW